MGGVKFTEVARMVLLSKVVNVGRTGIKFTRCTELRDSDRVKKKAQFRGNGGPRYLGKYR
jgi:hypothetical protein